MSRQAPGDLHVFETPAQVAEALADAFAETAARAIAERGTCAVALAGGTTPKAAYALLAQEPRRSSVDWSRVQIFFGDERCVPPESEESNYRTASLTFLNAVPIPAQNVHRMRGEDPPLQAAADYAALLVEMLGESPELDLVLLGMGADGHTASLFPGMDPYTDDAQLVRAPYVEKLHTYRLTLTPAVLNNARRIIVATEGDGKAEALHAVREGAYDPVRSPIQVLDPKHGTLEWFVDAAAAALLQPQ